MQSQTSSPSVAAMLSEAHLLYNISQGKIAHSHTIRGGISSMHKNLLLASIIHKTYNHIVENTEKQCWAYLDCESLKLSCETGQPNVSVLQEIRPTNNGESNISPKRRKTSEWSTEQAVLSNVPKESESQLDDSAIVDLILELEELAEPKDPSTTMDTDPSTSSLVSICSFGSLANPNAAVASASSGNAPEPPSTDLIYLQEAEDTSFDKENSLSNAAPPSS
ncbi:Hypothetical predicted protein [Cloeon dipterum]|uniref:Uncharacterized protein n=1 Tax=Cloeon dipterum TaxID=197152 RepID=A0A8S1CV80_9INSE|nr:Hypothetical predicted protein [Cloeon dipterum]